jgi:pimeloyl-ACP methyl ester carboxylesterase
LKDWLSWARRSRLEPLRKLAKTLSERWDAVVRGMLDSRSNAYVEAMNGLLQQPVEGAKATVFLFPGGAGGFGKFEDGKATGGNFLVRSAPYFIANGFNVAIFGRPNDMELGWAERTEPSHMTDVRAVLDFVKQKSTAPIWIVGTSRGTISAAASVIHIQDPAIAGLVLTSSVVKYDTPGTVPRQNLSAIKVPVLVYHHAKDGLQALPDTRDTSHHQRAQQCTRQEIDGGGWRGQSNWRRVRGAALARIYRHGERSGGHHLCLGQHPLELRLPKP